MSRSAIAIWALAGVLACNGARAQVHISESGSYTLRANVLSSEALPAGTAAKHGIERAPDRGVLNLVILRGKGVTTTVNAKVVVGKRNLLGQSESIAMREVNENGYVSYLGTFGFSPLHTFNFSISAQPEGSDEAITLEFEDRLAVRGER